MLAMPDREIVLLELPDAWLWRVGREVYQDDPTGFYRLEKHQYIRIGDTLKLPRTRMGAYMAIKRHFKK